MPRSTATAIPIACLAILVLCFGAGSSAAKSPPGLSPFSSDAELRRFLRENGPGRVGDRLGDGSVQDVIVVGARAAAPSIINNQVAGVDEGGIVKLHGDTLVILRRGRLFTVSTAGGGLRAVDTVSAYPETVDGEGGWYDEMLISGDRVIVIGYSYDTESTEINRFRISPAGKLAYEDTYLLKSDDYYSSRNYASRLVGDTLVFYTPLSLYWKNDPLERLPTLKRWRGPGKGAGKRIIDARQIYIAPMLRKAEQEVDTLHAVTQCDMAAPVMRCKSTGVLGSRSRSFYVSAEAIYLWVSESWGDAEGAPEASLYRVPLNGSRPQAIQARGTPLDQFSFSEEREKGFLNVAVMSHSGGDAMWRPEFARGIVALLHLPLSSFGDGSNEASKWDYRILPELADVSENRFVGDYFLYGGWADDPEDTGVLGVANLETQEVETFRLPQPVTRIEEMGRDALVVGSAKDLVLTTVTLGERPRFSQTLKLPGMEEGEHRSHGFFFRPDNDDGSMGVLGLATQRPEAPEQAEKPDWLPWSDRETDMLFAKRGDGRLTALGELKSDAKGRVDDGCVASCVDWYGDARPIFFGGRVFALLGYELVEGRVDGAAIREVGRVNFAPPPPPKD